MKQVLLVTAFIISLSTEASVMKVIAKKMDGLFSSKTPSIELVAKGKISESHMDNLIIRTNSEMGRGEVLESIGSKMIEAEFRNMDMAETLEELSQKNFNDRFLEKVLMDQMRSVATISAHNHLLLKKMNEVDRVEFIAQHRSNVSSALNEITSKISASGTYSFTSFKALRNIYMDLNNL